MDRHDDEENLLRSVAIQNASSILQARQRAEQELIQAKEALERKSEELAHSLAMMRATLESTTDAILVTDAAAKVTGYNEKYLALWRFPKDATASGKHQPLLTWAEKLFRDPQQFLDRIEEIYRTSPAESYDFQELNDGRTLERFSRIQYIEGHNAGRVWSFRDITEQRRTEEALRDETRILELLNTTGASLTSKLDLQTLLQTVTDAGTKLSGAKFGAFFYTMQDSQGEAFSLYTLSGAPREAFEKFGHPRATAIFGPTFRGEGNIRSDDITQDQRYGKMAPHYGMPYGHLPVRSYLSVSVISRSGKVLGGLFFGHPEPAVFTDRTERLVVGFAAQAAVAIDNAHLYEAAQKSAQERTELLESERAARAHAERMSDMKDEFLATLSHELRTPLSAILGWSQVLRRSKKSEADLEKGLETIERNARTQAQLIEDLLDMSRITSGKVRLDVQPLAPHSIIDAAVETIQPAADAKGIHIEMQLDQATGAISADPDRLQQVIWNLLSNAIKFTPKDGVITVRLAPVNSHIEIIVADTGMGIKPEFLAHVFDRFRQADASSTRRYGGLGLGLSIVKNLVELHGGTVSVASPGEGQGASFKITLPRITLSTSACDKLEKDCKAADVLPLAGVKPVNLAGIKVLVVDDEADGRELMQRVLSDCGAEVLTAARAAEAIVLMETRHPDVLVSDIGMPDVDGFEMLKRIRAQELTKGASKVPAVALTAFARSEDRTRALHAGFLAHVSKPVDVSELLATVASVAGRTGE